MPYNFQFSEEAEMDIFEGYFWYESQKTGLGEKFLDSLDHAERAIKRNPNSYRVRYKDVRGFLVERFPYIIIYVVKGDHIDVISVFNTNKDPGSWKNRIK